MAFQVWLQQMPVSGRALINGGFYMASVIDVKETLGVIRYSFFVKTIKTYKPRTVHDY